MLNFDKPCTSMINFFALIALLSAATVNADNSSGDSSSSSGKKMHHALTTPPNHASDASFDKRLPPVIPGEELSDSGKTVRVWSSAGPIPDSIHHPSDNCQSGSTNCTNTNGVGIGEVDVVIDRRRRTRPAKTSDSWGR